MAQPVRKPTSWVRNEYVAISAMILVAALILGIGVVAAAGWVYSMLDVLRQAGLPL